MKENNIEKLVNEYAISINRLQLECDKSNNKYGRTELNYYNNSDKKYNHFTNTNLNSMNTFNILRTLYRWFYDLRSMGKNDKDGNIVGREIHPIKNIEMNCNYLNDFSLSAKYTFTDNNFNELLSSINSMSMFSFINKQGYYKDLANNRLSYFIKSENNNDDNYTNDFFSHNIQVNPLLYTYCINDPSDNKVKYMDADLFLEMNLYNKIFNKNNFILKGNQYGIPLWLKVTNTNSYNKEIYNEEDDIKEYKIIYENKELLFKDDYTKNLLTIFQNGVKYYNFNKDRGIILYDCLLELVLRKVKDIIDEDKDNNPNYNTIIRKFNILKKIIYEDETLRDGMELNGFSYNQYLALDSFEDNIYTDDTTKNGLKELKDKIDNNIINIYQSVYDDVFAKLFRLLPFIFSPAYMFKIQSPAMNIFYMTLSIMAIKNAFNTNKREYNKIIENLYSVLNNIDDIKKDEVLDLFNAIFDSNFLIKNLKDHLNIVLKILIKNSSVNNEDNKYKYFNLDEYNSYIETGKDIDDNILIDKAIILLTELFSKLEDIKYFDASTFCIDIDSIKDSNERKSLRLFSESLLESCYIHLNILGSEVFFNNICNTSPYRNSNNSLFRSNLYNYLLGLDKTRVSKNNISLYNSWGINNNSYESNSYNSYISVINLYISLAYSIRITVDNLSINNYKIGISYDNLAMKRSQTFWSITKIYSFHLMYMNNNSYGIYNDVLISDNNKDILEKIMIAQRYKLLLYGLHLRVWYNDGYLFYTNYKKLMTEYNSNIENVLSEINRIYNYYPKENNLMPINLFKDIDKNISIILPNIGLSLYPLSGSYTLTSNAVCIKYYMNNNEVIVNLLHHGLKDIIVGDSLSSIIGDRLDCVKSLLDNDKISFNNLNGIFQKVYDILGYSTYHEIALSSNLYYIYINIIREHFLNNKNNCLLLNNNNTNGTLYDLQFFETLNDKCSYELAYNNSWSYRIIRNILSSNDKTSFIKFINNYINLYRLASVNFKAWHSKLKEDKSISNYYNNYYGLSIMNTIFVKDYKEGILKVIKDKGKYGIFNKIIKRIFTGNIYNNQYAISNLFSITNSKISFEDIIVNHTSGGTIFALYESPILLMIYNNIDFGSGYINPTLEQLYMLGRDLFGRIYSTMKRLYVDLTYNGNPIDKIQNEYKDYNIEDCKEKFISNSIDQFYIVTNNTLYNDNITEFYKHIINNDELYSFITIFGQFMDYDFIASQIINLITNNQYSLSKKEDVIKYINNLLSNSGKDIGIFKSYCDSIDKIDNQLNCIIRKIIERKCGSIITDIVINEYNKKEIDKKKDEVNSIKETIHTNYPIKIKDSHNLLISSNIDNLLSLYISYDNIGITKEEYKMLDKVKQEELDKIKNNIEKNEIDYNKEISEIELKLSQIKRAKLIKDGIEVYNNYEQEFYSKINKGKDVNLLLFEKLVDIDNKITSIKEILLDNNHMLRTLLDSNKDNINNSIDTIIVDEDNDNDTINDKVENDIISNKTVEIIEDNNQERILTIDGQIFSNKLEDYNYYISLPNVIDNNEYALPIMPIENEDKSIIEFYSNLGERCTVIKDLRADKDIDISIIKDHYKRNYFQSNNKILDKPTKNYYSVKDNKEVNYNNFLYIPESYLIEYIPYYTNPNSIVSINKAILQEIPLYMNDLNDLLLVFYNIPISFNQRYEYIVKAIKERIEVINKDISNKIIEEMNRIEIYKYWDKNDLTLVDRINVLEDLFNRAK